MIATSAAPRFLARSLVVGMVLTCTPMRADAVILGTCTIVVGPSGTLKINPALKILSSKQTGGSPATATITAASVLCSLLALLDCYSISAPAPAAFLTAPAAGQTNLSFLTSFKLNGGAEQPGNTPFRVANGVYTTQVDLVATKLTGVFAAGTYQAQVLVRCE